MEYNKHTVISPFLLVALSQELIMGALFQMGRNSRNDHFDTLSFDMERAVDSANNQLDDLSFKCFACPLLAVHICVPRRLKYREWYERPLGSRAFGYDGKAEELIISEVKKVFDSAPFDVTLQREVRENEIILSLDNDSVQRGREHFLQCAEDFRDRVCSRHSDCVDRLARAVLEHNTIGIFYKTPFDYDLDSESIEYSGPNDSCGYAFAERLDYSELGLGRLRHFHQWLGLAYAISSRMSELHPTLGEADSVDFYHRESLRVRYATKNEVILEEW